MTKKPENKKKLPKFLRIIFIVLGSFCAVYLLIFLLNWFASLSLRSFIRSFDPVEYDVSTRILPEKDSSGYYCFQSDSDIKVLLLTDLHIGGGIFSVQQDRKTVYEVICMLQQEKPDLVITTGDNVFPVPGPVFNGGGTLDNLMVARDVLTLFEHEGVYFTTTFGNHDTEAFDYANRAQAAKLYQNPKYTYCILEQNYTDSEVSMPSATNQVIYMKNLSGAITKVLLLIDSNAYIDTSISASINWQYDVIHKGQSEWAAKVVKEARQQNEAHGFDSPKVVAFMHIPVGEYETAYRDLSANHFENTETTIYESGIWDELVDPDMGGRIWYGGCGNQDVLPEDADDFFETLGPDGENALEAIYCGHDHVNNAIVSFRGVKLCYNYSLDNLAYDQISQCGLHRGSTVLRFSKDFTYTSQQKNLYTDYDVDPKAFYDVQWTSPYYEDYAPGK